jgi:hypothetical protein
MFLANGFTKFQTEKRNFHDIDQVFALYIQSQGFGYRKVSFFSKKTAD